MTSSFFGNNREFNAGGVESLGNYSGDAAANGDILVYDSATTRWRPTSNLTFLNSFKFESSGTYTPSASAKFIQVYVVGAGGAGGGALTGANKSVGPGGASGGTVHAIIEVGTSGGTATITIGTGGTGVTGAVGGAGGNSEFSFNSNILVASGGPASAAPIQNSFFDFSASTLAGSGTITEGDGFVFGEIFFGSDGEYAFTTHQNSTAVSGRGGSSRYGKGGDKRSATTSTSFAGIAGTGYGSGGGGALQCDNAGTKAGGNGAAGVVYVVEMS